jgi:hypothetical protein
MEAEEDNGRSRRLRDLGNTGGGASSRKAGGGASSQEPGAALAREAGGDASSMVAAVGNSTARAAVPRICRAPGQLRPAPTMRPFWAMAARMQPLEVGS